MSAFIVSDATMCRVLQGIVQAKNWKAFTLAEVFVPTDSVTQQEEALTELGKRLFAMNSEAVDQRYGRGTVESDGIPLDDFKFEFISLLHDPSPTLKTDWYKAMDCLLYQCAEGDVPRCRTYKELMEIRRDLAEGIIRDLDMWKHAPWDTA
jgi:hypothetical protein